MERHERQTAEIQQYLSQYEHDACGLMAVCARDGQPSHGILMRALEALRQMVHRSGDVDGEGDGCGLQLDLPRRLWAGCLTAAGLDPALSAAPSFAVAHLFLPQEGSDEAMAAIRQILVGQGFSLHLERVAVVTPSALGPRGRAAAPLFWQVALTAPGGEAACWQALIAIEGARPAVHVCSFSTQTVVYKVRGDARTLAAYYPDLADLRCESRAAIGHNRYSTNTSTAFERVQPFSLLGHNGEINTIRQLREQTAALGIPLTSGGSDSQDLNRALEGLLYHFELTLFEAVELLFPPIIGEVKGMPPDLQDHYMYDRVAWGPFAQGPAALCLRAGELLAASVDAMGLRPLWLLQTAEALYFSSEQGIIAATEMTADPHPLAPGERMGIILAEGQPPQILDYTDLQQWVLQHARRRFPAPEGLRETLNLGGPVGESDEALAPFSAGEIGCGGDAGAPALSLEHRLAWGGWSADDKQLIAHMATAGAEPIGSLGWDGPLAALADGRQNLADFFKEAVAVVTNPAVDREREVEHFSTRTLIGPRLALKVDGPEQEAFIGAPRVQLRLPVLLGGHAGPSPVGRAAYQRIARAQGTWLLEDLLAYFGPALVHVVPACQAAAEPLPQALQRLASEAEAALRGGARVLLIDDSAGLRQMPDRPIDPLLLVTALDNHLKAAKNPSGTALRRRTALILRSGWLRNLHDVALAVGLGADAVNPYAMLEVAAETGALLTDEATRGIENLVGALQKGLEKVISTLGIHELRGYSRLFASIGLKPALADQFRVENFMGSAAAGRGFAELEADAAARAAGVTAKPPTLYRERHLWPRLWKAAGEAGRDPAAYQAYRAKLAAQESETPVSLRHLLDLKESTPTTGPIDLTIDGYALPLTISGMSFGSQGETAFRAYAEAAKRLEIVAMNGEGGEIPNMIGRYFKWRGQQVASGRFGVNTPMLAGSRFIEIKVGQGAKPGEGGHLPGMKVSAKVAKARNAVQGTDLISPSNNHDVYSIEDLAQLVEELRTVNPHAKIVVKIPVVPGIGTIAVGVAKAGADIIALCGYDGGTGAARKHALRHAGLPIEIGVREAHLALVVAGIRDRVEVWGDSGVKSGLDVVKLMLLGANRVGFATLAMVAIGCTICRGCQLDTCHVGIATQVETQAEAAEKGINSFKPREYEAAVQALVTLFGQIGAEVRDLVRQLGFRRAQDLVGRAELLAQRRGLAQLDLSDLVLPLAWARSRSAAPVRQIGKGSLGEQFARDGLHQLDQGENVVRLTHRGARSTDRFLGTRLAGDLARLRLFGSVGNPLKRASGGKSGEDGAALQVAAALQSEGAASPLRAQIELLAGSIAGNGLCAFGGEGVQVRVEGGAQDSVGKGLLGGRIAILKAANERGALVGGSVGKSFAYGAQAGLFLIQGDADSRCGIRLSGADLVLGGKLRGPLQDQKGSLATRSNLKGFAFEYMTQGRVVVLGDPGPWICSGMTGGVVYVRLQPALGLDEAAVQRRFAKGARVKLMKVGQQGQVDLAELLSAYRAELFAVGQVEEAEAVGALRAQEFVAIVPESQQTDPAISTE
ncbi:MAG TPA: glutamate synthase-related protein [Symbiobacteriaceae bacterium]|nr:glutamate synthase-related protein [Symbiobacteriaceae bacterium]